MITLISRVNYLERGEKTMNKKKTAFLKVYTVKAVLYDDFLIKYSRMGSHWLIFNKGLFLDEYRHGARRDGII